MLRLLFLLSLSLLVNCYAHAPAQAQPSPPPGTYPPGAPPPPPPPHHHHPTPDMGGPAPGAENCGTPDEPKACPPLPRVPLQNYPANRP
jgi:hypothetical protein